MRHRLVHHYFAVDLDVLWDVVQHDVPELARLVEALLPDEAREAEAAAPAPSADSP